MGEVRSFREEDLPTVACMFETVLMRRRARSSVLAPYLDELYLRSPGDYPDITSKVHVDDSGEIDGFIGAIPTAMTIDKRPIVAAMCSSMMVDARRADPTVAGRLMRAVLQGPQDLSYAETASAVSVAMWKGLRGSVMPLHSLDWLRVFAPVGFSLHLAAKQTFLAPLLAGLASPLDRVIRGRRLGPRSWRLPVDTSPLSVQRLDHEQTAALIREFAGDYRLAPSWSIEELKRRLGEATRKTTIGEMVCGAVHTANGTPVGLFIYHGSPNGVGQVLQCIARPNRTAAVLDRMFAYAAENGLIAIRGRSTPEIVDAMPDRHLIFTSKASTVVAAKDPAILSALAEGRALLTGLAGETWNRLNGDVFT
jgi:hypothetical protein